MTDFAEVTTLDKVPPGTGNRFTLADKEVALFNVSGTVYAIDDSCLCIKARPWQQEHSTARS